MPILFLGLFLTFFNKTVSAQMQSAPTHCPIGAWVIILNDQGQSSPEDIVKANEVIIRAQDVLKVVRITPESDGSLVYNLQRNPKLSQNSQGKALEVRTIHAIFGSFKAWPGMNFYCFN